MVEITTSFDPKVPLGVIKDKEVELFTVTPVADAPPTVMPVVELRFVPISWVEVPPAGSPVFTDNEESIGLENGESLLETG